MSSENEFSYVSTGALPSPGMVTELVREAHERYRRDTSGELSGVYPALARADPDRFGVSVLGPAAASTRPATRSSRSR